MAHRRTLCFVVALALPSCFDGPPLIVNPVDDQIVPGAVRLRAVEQGQGVDFAKERAALDRAFESKALGRETPRLVDLPAPEGCAWMPAAAAARVYSSVETPVGPLALVRVRDDSEFGLGDFQVLGEEEFEGGRALRLRVRDARRGAFDALVAAAARGQLVFVADGRALLALNVWDPLEDAELLLTDLPEPGAIAWFDAWIRGATLARPAG